MYIGDRVCLENLPEGVCNSVEERAGSGVFIRLNSDLLSKGHIDGIKIFGLKRWLAFSRIDPYWIEPFYGDSEMSVPKETQYLLWERDDGCYGIILPLIDGDLRATAEGSENGLSLVFNGSLGGQLPKESVLAFVGMGADPYTLTYEAMKTVKDHLHSFRMRDEKPKPDYLDYLGWCTWDAFHHSVDEAKVLEGLDTFKAGGIQPGFMILDDGWLDVEKDFLTDFGANLKQFPNGLSSLIKKVKAEYAIEKFAVWHAFEGYWTGINPKGRLAEQYRLVHNVAVIRPWDPKDEDLYLVDPRDVHRFYFDFYRFLHKEGVDMVKVDGQSALELFTEGRLGRVSTMKVFQEAMQGAAKFYFNANVIHCMCNGSDVAYNMLASNGWRNSRDHFPNHPAHVHQKHVQINIMNNLWTSAFSIPDWDMFQSHNEDSEFHAAARAVSGGPVYVSDKPGKQNFELLGKLCISGGKVLVCDRPALPTRDCIFVDCYNEAKLLKVSNKSRNIGVLGLFHCQNNGDVISDKFCPAEVCDITGENFAVYLYKREELKVLSKDQYSSIEISKMDYELVTFSPIENGIAPIGLLDKFNSAAAFISWKETGNKHYTAVLKDGGERIGFYASSKPGKVLVEGKGATMQYNSENGLLTVSAPVGNKVKVEIFL